MEDALIRFRGVRKAFGPKVVYDNLDLDIPRGKVLTIVGGSGVGKSVMLKMLIGLLTPDRGTVTFDGREVGKMSNAELSVLRQRIAMLFQGGALFDSIDVRDNVAYGLEEHFRYKMTKAEIDERVAWALELVGLPGVQDMRPSDLSGGMKKRVALARAIAVRPEVVLYDEPTTGLDPIMSDVINRLIRSLQQRIGVTSIVVTHDLHSAYHVGDVMAMLNEGHVVFSGTPEQMRASNDPFVRQFVQGTSEGPVQPH
jgi:phospholipid/cholesterol/gamma-HCH transport system ATP-binding protein